MLKHVPSFAFLLCLNVICLTYFEKIAIQCFSFQEPRHSDSFTTFNPHIYTHNAPLTVRIVGNQVFNTGARKEQEVHHIELEHSGKFQFWEGQSIGIIPPGCNPKSGRLYRPRLYTISSSRYGDDGLRTKLSLCIRRAQYTQLESDAIDYTKQGVCSNFLCTAPLNTEVQVTGPTGKVMILPENNTTSKINLIWIGTGTGIAPFRAFWQRIFMESHPHVSSVIGNVWLLYGIKNHQAILYKQEIEQLKKNPQFRVDLALSQTLKNLHGDKMYIQDLVSAHAHEILKLLQGGAHIYLCGLKQMVPGILSSLNDACLKENKDWSELYLNLKREKRWKMEVY